MKQPNLTEVMNRISELMNHCTSNPRKHVLVRLPDNVLQLVPDNQRLPVNAIAIHTLSHKEIQNGFTQACWEKIGRKVKLILENANNEMSKLSS